MKKFILIAILVAGYFHFMQSPGVVPNSSAAFEQKSVAEASGNQQIATAFEQRLSNIQVEGQGTVSRILSDDLDGSRHQKFIVQLADGQTLLLAHNIDLAPRVDGLRQGDRVAFYGEYEWSPKGGIVHWTHHDPSGRHESGWIKHHGNTYQ
jgi:hypothetical protein